ncbi:hypothetical protein DKX38_011111 [Salix brachista]|uniref:Uncharacterized protein n=1 Tax=Salix brachista TaxID=2182728 RepID=A0A5N5LXV9_9ROSI|nr:hypothetical protein DKX38_011111 [Salix brachista]
MMSSHALTSAEKSSSRILSAKPEWDKSQARFLQSFSVAKGDGISAKPTDHIASSLSFQHFGYQKVTEEGGKIYPFGSDSTGSPDNYVCRQRYLRSYVFTREEEGSKSVVEKFKRLFKQKKAGKSGNANSCSFSDTCLKFLCCIVKADVQT